MLRLDWGLRRSNQPHAHLGGDSIMKREIIRVEPLSPIWSGGRRRPLP
jgi:hypothetical protein